MLAIAWVKRECLLYECREAISISRSIERGEIEGECQEGGGDEAEERDMGSLRIHKSLGYY